MTDYIWLIPAGALVLIGYAIYKRFMEVFF